MEESQGALFVDRFKQKLVLVFLSVKVAIKQSEVRLFWPEENHGAQTILSAATEAVQESCWNVDSLKKLDKNTVRRALKSI